MIKKIIFFVCIASFFVSCSVVVPYAATNNEIGNKVGKSSTVCIGGVASAPSPGSNIIATGSMVLNSNYGISEAAANGGIKKIATIDVKLKTFLFFSKYELIVTGE